MKIVFVKFQLLSNKVFVNANERLDCVMQMQKKARSSSQKACRSNLALS